MYRAISKLTGRVLGENESKEKLIEHVNATYAGDFRIEIPYTGTCLICYARLDATKNCPTIGCHNHEPETPVDESAIDWLDFEIFLREMAVGSSDQNTRSDEESDQKYFTRLAADCSYSHPG